MTLDILSGICLVLGAALSLAAGIGLFRFPDALSRIHAATKPQILGLVFILAGVALEARLWSTLLALLPVLIFQLLTAPISAHMIGRAGYRTANFAPETLHIDELAGAIDSASAAGDDAAAERIGAMPEADGTAAPLPSNGPEADPEVGTTDRP